MGQEAINAGVDTQTKSSSMSHAEAQLCDIIENPRAHNFGDSFFDVGDPLGFDYIFECESVETLKKYRELCESELIGDYFSDNPDARRRADAKYSVLNTIDQQIERRRLSDEENWPVSPEFIEFVRGLSTPSDSDYKFDRQGWKHVWEICTPDDLSFIAEVFSTEQDPDGKHHDSNPTNTIINAFLYYHGEVCVESLFNVDNRGKGPSPQQIFRNLDSILSRLDPVLGSLIPYWVDRVTTNVSESGGGKYSYDTHQINISSDQYISHIQRNSGYENTTAHEIGHMIGHLYGFRFDSSSGEYDDWFGQLSSDQKKTTAQIEFSETAIQQWTQLTDGKGESEPIEEYQLKSPCETVAVAFETWIVNPLLLVEKQPRMYELFNTHFGPRPHEANQS